MEVRKTLNVSMQEMDEFVRLMVAQDIKAATNKTKNPNDIRPGYSYHKELTARSGKKGRVVTHIDALESGLYKASFDSNQGVNDLSYEYSAKDDNSIELRYSENYQSKTKSQDINYRIMDFLYKHSNKKRINLMLNHIENMIQENRKARD